MGWQRKVLRVNLTERTCKPEPLNMEWARQYLGQRGLATKYLCEEIDPACDPLSPDNKMIMVTGPLTGTMASTGGRYSVVTKGPLTGAIGNSDRRVPTGRSSASSGGRAATASCPPSSSTRRSLRRASTESAANV